MSAVYADLYRYRELFANLLRRDVRAKYKGSVLGVAWTLAYPLLLMAVYLLVFSVLLQRGGAVPHYALFLLSGLVTWTFFAMSIQNASRSMLDNANLIRKVRFPRQLVTFVVMLVAVTALDLVIIPATRDTFWMGPLLAVPLVAFVAGFALMLSSLNVLFRDIEFLVQAMLLPWFFLTPVLYPLDSAPGASKYPWLIDLLHWGNPLTPAVEAIRAPIYSGTAPTAGDVVYLCVSAVVALVLGAWVFRRIDDQIAVEI